MIIKNKTSFINLLKAVCNNNEHVCETLSVSANNHPQEIKIVGEKLTVILLSSQFQAQDRILKCHFFLQCVTEETKSHCHPNLLVFTENLIGI